MPISVFYSCAFCGRSIDSKIYKPKIGVRLCKSRSCRQIFRQIIDRKFDIALHDQIISNSVEFKNLLLANKFYVKNIDSSYAVEYKSLLAVNDCILYIFFGSAKNGWLRADRADTFNKLSQCPLQMKFPFHFEILFESLKFLSTLDGKEYSESYNFCNVNKRIIPYQEIC